MPLPADAHGRENNEGARQRRTYVQRQKAKEWTNELLMLNNTPAQNMCVCA